MVYADKTILKTYVHQLFIFYVILVVPFVLHLDRATKYVLNFIFP